MAKHKYIHLDCGAINLIVDLKQINISEVNKTKCWCCRKELINIKEVSNG